MTTAAPHCDATTDSHGTLAALLHRREPGSARHRVLLAEQRRRRTGAPMQKEIRP